MPLGPTSPRCRTKGCRGGLTSSWLTLEYSEKKRLRTKKKEPTLNNTASKQETRKHKKKRMIADAGTTLASARCHTQKRVEHEWRRLAPKSGCVKKLSSSSTSLLQQHGASSPSSSPWSGIHQKRPNLMREHHRPTRPYTNLCLRWSSLMWYLAACQTWHKRMVNTRDAFYEARQQVWEAHKTSCRARSR